MNNFAGFPEPFWAAPSARLYLGDVRARLRAMPVRSVHCCVTSPPYWGLRDYGTGTWEGGSAECDHSSGFCTNNKGSTTLHSGGAREFGGGKAYYLNQCKKCGAKRTDMQLGAEPSPDCGTHGQAQCGGCFVCSLVGVFREVRRVLRDDGVLWLNLGDTYASGSVGVSNHGQGKSTIGFRVDGSYTLGPDGSPYLNELSEKQQTPRKVNTNLLPGNLVGVPWRVALALQTDGWVLRSDIPWVKRTAMPESVLSRPCKSLEYIFMLTECNDHYFDMEAIRPAASGLMGGSKFGKANVPEETARRAGAGGSNRDQDDTGGRPQYTKRGFRNGDLWFQSVAAPFGAVGVGDEIVGLDVTSQGYPGAHFAVFPGKLIEPLILAGTSECGCCAQCGAAYARDTVKEGQPGRDDLERQRDRSMDRNRNGVSSTMNNPLRTVTLGWRKVCGCQTDEVVPCVVLDPFVGSGTTVSTALQLGRAGIGIDLSETYLRENAIPRIEAAMRGEKVPRKPTVVRPPEVAPTPERM